MKFDTPQKAEPVLGVGEFKNSQLNEEL